MGPKYRGDGTLLHKWSVQEEDDLLDLYEDHPELYNPDIKGYSDNQLRFERYRGFATALGNPFKVVSKRYKMWFPDKIMSFRCTL